MPAGGMRERSSVVIGGKVTSRWTDLRDSLARHRLPAIPDVELHDPLVARILGIARYPPALERPDGIHPRRDIWREGDGRDDTWMRQ